jgi:hypothetical protein
MTAQLLWDPNQSPKTLLDEFYDTFFGKAAPQMRDFYAICEKAWLKQPQPGRWIKYYQDQDQVLLFPPKVRRLLFNALASASAAAQSRAVTQRVALVSAAFTATDAFCRVIEHRRGLSQLSSASEPEQQFRSAYATALLYGAMSKVDTTVYFRVASFRAEPPIGRTTQPSSGEYPSRLLDPAWETLRPPPLPLTDVTFQWSPKSSPWMARGEPAEHRQITLIQAASARTVRFAGCNSERISQWLEIPRNLARVAQYHVQTMFRGQVTPGNESYLIVSFLDARNGYVGDAPEARVCPGLYKKPISLSLDVSVPPGATHLGVGVYVYHQNPGDWSEFIPPTLQPF